jgi:hypothetical protein
VLWAFSTGQLYTDREEALFQAARPVILNGIEETDEIPVKILKIARNGVFIELMLPDGVAPPDGIKRKARVARDRLLPVRPPPAPFVRKTLPASDLPPPPSRPPLPVGEMPKDRIPPMPVGAMPKDRMLGEPGGRIPTFLPKPWDPARCAARNRVAVGNGRAGSI